MGGVLVVGLSAEMIVMGCSLLRMIRTLVLGQDHTRHAGPLNPSAFPGKWFGMMGFLFGSVLSIVL